MRVFYVFVFCLCVLFVLSVCALSVCFVYFVCVLSACVLPVCVVPVCFICVFCLCVRFVCFEFLSARSMRNRRALWRKTRPKSYPRLQIEYTAASLSPTPLTPLPYVEREGVGCHQLSFPST